MNTSIGASHFSGSAPVKVRVVHLRVLTWAFTLFNSLRMVTCLPTLSAIHSDVPDDNGADIGAPAVRRIGAPLLVAALVLCTATVPATPRNLVDRLHADAVEQFRAARFSAAYGHFVALADMHHQPSAHCALWMCRHGLELFGKDWDCTSEQLQDWSQLAGVPTLPLQPRHYGRHVVASGRPAAATPARPQGH